MVESMCAVLDFIGTVEGEDGKMFDEQKAVRDACVWCYECSRRGWLSTIALQVPTVFASPTIRTISNSITVQICVGTCSSIESLNRAGVHLEHDESHRHPTHTTQASKAQPPSMTRLAGMVPNFPPRPLVERPV